MFRSRDWEKCSEVEIFREKTFTSRGSYREVKRKQRIWEESAKKLRFERIVLTSRDFKWKKKRKKRFYRKSEKKVEISIEKWGETGDVEIKDDKSDEKLENSIVKWKESKGFNRKVNRLFTNDECGPKVFFFYFWKLPPLACQDYLYFRY